MQQRWRFFLILGFGFLCFFALMIKGYLNIGDDNLKKKSQNRIQKNISHKAPRGKILDYQGRILTMDMALFEYDIDMAYLRKQWSGIKNQQNQPVQPASAYLSYPIIKQVIIDIANVLNVSAKTFANQLKKYVKTNKKWSIQKQVTLQEHLNFQTLKDHYVTQQNTLVRQFKLKYPELSDKKKIKDPQQQELWQQKQQQLETLTIKQEILTKFFESISSHEYYHRFYPFQNIASQLLGHLSLGQIPISEEVDGEIQTHYIDRFAFNGVEKALDKQLRGQYGDIKFFKDRNNKAVKFLQTTPENKRQVGQDIQLTIDYELQYILNRELYKYYHLHKAQSASALLIEVKSGAIKAVASQPNYNPNNTKERTGSRTRLRPLLDYVEPGSVQKPLLIAAGLESNELSINSTVSVSYTNHFSWRQTPLLERRYAKPTEVGMEEVIKYSLNSGIVKFAEKVDKASLWALYKKLGYGASYDIFTAKRGLSSLPHSDSWSDSEYFTRTYGYEEKLTMFNLIAFYLAVANQGILTPMHILPMSEEEITAKSIPVLSTNTASIMSDLLHQVTQGNGTGRLARIKGIEVAGKTGTTRKGGVSILKHRASFVGFARRHNPKYVLAVMLDEPSANDEFYSGGKVAAPLFSAVMEQVLRLP